MSTRLETKWAASASSLPRIANLLLSEGYYVLYPARRIFSVYYDGDRVPEYWRGEEGVVPRKKHRIRWYHSLDGYREKSSYEVKITAVDGRRKFSARVDENAKGRHPEIVTMLRLIESREISPLSLVNYVRRYFGHESGRRFTVDHDITYRRVLKFDSRMLNAGSAARDEDLALELKAPYEIPDLNFSETVPMTRVRFSKYSRSIERLSIV